jgi:hypothetical protein
MTSLLQADFYLTEGESIKASVEALNTIDFSYASEVSGDAIIQIEPSSPLIAMTRGSETSES